MKHRKRFESQSSAQRPGHNPLARLRHRGSEIAMPSEKPSRDVIQFAGYSSVNGRIVTVNSPPIEISGVDPEDLSTMYSVLKEALDASQQAIDAGSAEQQPALDEDTFEIHVAIHGVLEQLKAQRSNTPS